MNQNSITVVNAILLVVLLAVLYFFFFRPDRKERQEKERLQDQLKVGDKVTTRAGLHGTVVAINGDLVLFETGKARTQLEILRSAILGRDDGSAGKTRFRTAPLIRDE